MSLNISKTFKQSVLSAAILSIGLVGVWSMQTGVAQAHDNHDHHAMEAQKKQPAKRSVVEVKLPNTALIRQDGTNVNLGDELNNGKPTILAFVYTSCTAVCPLTSQIMSQTQEVLGADLKKVNLVSISIDPEYDTPARLAAYAKTFGAKPEWKHYTGTLAGSVEVQKAFSSYRGDKMNHAPVIFVRGKNSWVRLEGFPSAEQVVKEYREQSAS